MSRSRCAIHALVFWAGLLSINAAADEANQGGGSTNPKLEKDTFALINRYRASEHLAPLLWNDAAAKAARTHSRDMALDTVDFGHSGFAERVKQLRSEIPGVTGAGENVLMTSDPVEPEQQAVTNWLKSAPHRHNIRADFVASGIGVWISAEGTIYFTQIFVKIARTSDPDDPGL